MEKLDITEEDIESELDSLILEKYLQEGWNKHQMYRDKNLNAYHWTIMAAEVRSQAEIRARERKKKEYEYEIDNKKRKHNQEKRNLPLGEDDVIGLTLFDSSVIQQGLQELNVEIFKRIVREKYPHKFV